MKRLQIFLLMFSVLVSCVDDFPEYYWGTVSALKNGEPWNGQIFAGLYEPYGFFIHVDVFNDQGIHRELFIISKIPAEEQRNRIDTIRERVDTVLTAASYGTSDGDVQGDLFIVLEGEFENYVTVTSYSEITGEVRGEFAVSFIFGERGGHRSDPSAPDTIRFTKGEFHTLIREPL